MLCTCERDFGVFFIRHFVALYIFSALSECYAAKEDNRQKVYSFIDFAFRIKSSLLPSL